MGVWRNHEAWRDRHLGDREPSVGWIATDLDGRAVVIEDDLAVAGRDEEPGNGHDWHRSRLIIDLRTHVCRN